MKKRARECPKADIELFSDLYSKEYAESAEEHVFHKILQKEKVGYGWTILDALYEENENWYEAITMVYCLERKQKELQQAKELYRLLVTDYSGSVYSIEAAKLYRDLEAGEQTEVNNL